MRSRGLIVLLLLSSVARSGEDDGAPPSAADHVAAGGALFRQGHYPEALIEFKAARQIDALPEIDLSIARCHERMGKRGPAIVAYRRFIAAAPRSPEAASARERV